MPTFPFELKMRNRSVPLLVLPTFAVLPVKKAKSNADARLALREVPETPSTFVPERTNMRPRLPSVRVMRAVLTTSNAATGLVVPIPTLPAKYAVPVVVAPPLMVSPPAWVPLPIVDEALTM